MSKEERKLMTDELIRMLDKLDRIDKIMKKVSKQVTKND